MHHRLLQDQREVLNDPSHARRIARSYSAVSTTSIHINGWRSQLQMARGGSTKPRGTWTHLEHIGENRVQVPIIQGMESLSKLQAELVM